MKIFLAGVLASGLVLSPLNAARVLSATLIDETPVAVTEASQPEQATPETESQPPVSDATLEPVEKAEPVVDPSTPEPPNPVTEEVTTPAETPAPEETTVQPVTETVPSPVDETPSPGLTEAVTQPVLTDQSAEVTPVDGTPHPVVTETEIVPTDTSLALETPVTTLTPEPEPEIKEAVVPTTSPIVAGKVLIQLKSGMTTEEMTGILASLGFTAIDSGTATGALLVDVPAGQELETASLLQSTNGVAYAQPVYTASALGLVPNDPFYSLQSNLAAINAEEGWQYFTGSSGMIVAVIDTGVDLTSADFAGRLVEGYDFVNYDSTPMDDNGHGSHVAGIMAATGNNDFGIAGLDWSAKIMPVKVLDSTGHGSDLNVYRGILYAVDHGAKVINLSLGFNGYSYLVESAVNYAYQHGVTVVASSGNTGGQVTFPANLPHVIAVGAVDDWENRAVYSNFGNELDLVAPGNNIFSLTDTGFTYKTGTSMAAPQVAGLASLLRGLHPLTNDQTESIIKSASKDLGTTGWDMYFGNGLIQVRESMVNLYLYLRSYNQSEPAEEDEAPTVYPTFNPTMTPTMTPTPTLLP